MCQSASPRRQPVWEKKKSEFKPAVLRLKMDLCLTLRVADGSGWYEVDFIETSQAYMRAYLPRPSLREG